MNFIQIEIKGLPHCPRNRSHAIMKKGPAHFLGKTEAAHAYEKALLQMLLPYTYKATEFLARFDKENHHLVAIWEFQSPEVKTASGRYSQTSTDLDAHKVLQDTVMEFIGIDDGFIIRDTRSKIHGDYAVRLDLRIVSNDGSDLL